jgi:hypothetical protein
MSDSNRREIVPSGKAAARHVTDSPSSSSPASRQAAWYSSAKRASVHPTQQHARINGSAAPPTQYHSVSQIFMPPVPDSSTSSELLRLLLVSGRPPPTVTAPLIPAACTQSTLREQILSLLGDRSEGDFRQTAQFQDNSNPLREQQLTAFSDGSNRDFRQILSAAAPFPSFQGPMSDLPPPSSQFALEEQQMVAMILGGRASLPAPRPPTLEQQLASLINEERVRLDIATLARSIHSASRYPTNLPAEPPAPSEQPLSLEQLYLLTQLQQNSTSLPTIHPGRYLSHGASAASSLDSLLRRQGLAVPAPAPPSVAAPSTVTTFLCTSSSNSPPADSPALTPTPIRGHGGGSQQVPFPIKLYHLLADVERHGNTHIVSFTPDGRAFKIHDPEFFMTNIAPDFFRQSHITSFVRQLNFYGFDRVSHGLNRGAFAHPSFLRGRPELLDSIERQIVPPRTKKRRSKAKH